jgi:hypothetical protein
MPVNIYQTVRLHVLEDRKLHIRSTGNLKSHVKSRQIMYESANFIIIQNIYKGFTEMC